MVAPDTQITLIRLSDGNHYRLGSESPAHPGWIVHKICPNLKLNTFGLILQQGETLWYIPEAIRTTGRDCVEFLPITP